MKLFNPCCGGNSLHWPAQHPGASLYHTGCPRTAYLNTDYPVSTTKLQQNEWVTEKFEKAKALKLHIFKECIC